MKTLFRNRLKKTVAKTISILTLTALTACAETPANAQLNRIIGVVGQHFIPDKRMAIFDVKALHRAGMLVLTGETTEPLARQALLDSLAKADLTCIDSVKLLPDPALGDTTWGLATLSVVPIRAHAGHAAEMVTQALMGTPMRILQISENWVQVQTPDRYIGWMEQNGLTRLTTAALEQWKKGNRMVYNRINGQAFDSPSGKSNVVTDLVLGDILQVEDEQNGFIRIRIPDGRTGYVNSKECLSWSEWVNRPPDIPAMLSKAQQLLGLPYLWGGTSTKAADCSGLTKTAWFSQAVILARDASQQARYGEPIDFSDRKKLQPGDLLFFGEEKEHITHVGLYLGNDLYIHASGLVRINSLNPEAENYLPGTHDRWISAIRVINALDQEGITRVSSHPWYN